MHLVQCVYVNWRTTTSHYLPKSIKRELQNSADEATRRVLIKNYRGQHSKLVRSTNIGSKDFLSSIRNIEKYTWGFNRRLGITENFGNFAKVSYFKGRGFFLSCFHWKNQYKIKSFLHIEASTLKIWLTWKWQKTNFGFKMYFLAREAKALKVYFFS